MVQIRPSMARFDHFLVDITPKPCYNNLRWFFLDGEMAERLMALVLKTSDAERHRGFESLSLRHFLSSYINVLFRHGEVPKWPKGLPC